MTPTTSTLSPLLDRALQGKIPWVDQSCADSVSWFSGPACWRRPPPELHPAAPWPSSCFRLGTEKVPQRNFVTKILPNVRVNFLVRIASKPLFYWVMTRQPPRIVQKVFWRCSCVVWHFESFWAPDSWPFGQILGSATPSFPTTRERTEDPISTPTPNPRIP